MYQETINNIKPKMKYNIEMKWIFYHMRACVPQDSNTPNLLQY